MPGMSPAAAKKNGVLTAAADETESRERTFAGMLVVDDGDADVCGDLRRQKRVCDDQARCTRDRQRAQHSREHRLAVDGQRELAGKPRRIAARKDDDGDATVSAYCVEPHMRARST